MYICPGDRFISIFFGPIAVPIRRTEVCLSGIVTRSVSLLNGEIVQGELTSLHHDEPGKGGHNVQTFWLSD